MRRRAILGTLVVVVCSYACGDEKAPSPDMPGDGGARDATRPGRDGATPGDDGSVTPTPPTPPTPPSGDGGTPPIPPPPPGDGGTPPPPPPVPPPPPPPPPEGALGLTLTADVGAAADEVVSLGVPFPPGTLTDASLIVVRDDSGAEVAVHSAALATWPADGSLRSVFVAFRASLASGASARWSIEYGAAPSMRAGVLAAAPDGPVSAVLDASWYATSRVIGFQVAAADNRAFPDWETEIEGYYDDMHGGTRMQWRDYGLDCDRTSAERTYYDGPHALYQRFIHRATADTFRRAREESLWYRANEITWHGDVAVYSCQDPWDPASPMDWGNLRRMLGQGMLDDYLLTGDPEALRTLRGLGEAFRQNLDALTMGGREITVYVTERNMAWPLMGLASYYAVSPTAEVRAALDRLVQMTIDWQARGTSGAFEHDIVRPDPEECGDGPAGGSPFMTSLLVDGLMDAYFLTEDARILPVVTRVAEWYRDDTLTTDGTAFQYLWGCNDVDYTGDPGPDLNLLISHVFGAAYFASRDDSWLDFGDTMANHGVENIYAGAPKQWNQSTRGFLKYLGYRAIGRAP